MLSLRVLGRHVPSDGLATVDPATGQRRVLHDRPWPGAIGPLPTTWGPRWMSACDDAASLWAVITAHAEGAPDAMAVAALRDVVDALLPVDPVLGVDAEATWFDPRGHLVHLEPVAGMGPGRGVPQLARYLLRGELAHGAEGGTSHPLITALERCGTDLAAMRGALSSVDADRDALGAAVFAVGADPIDPGHPRRGQTCGVGMAAAPQAGPPPRVLVARVAGLTLLLGVLAGWFLAPTQGGAGPRVLDVTVHGAEAFTLECGKARFLVAPASAGIVVPAGPCRISAMIDGVWKGADVDTTQRLKYECRVRGGEVACDEG